MATNSTKKIRTTGIRPKALARVNAVLRANAVSPFLPAEDRLAVDFISKAADKATQPLIKKHKIQLPPDAAFDTAA